MRFFRRRKSSPSKTASATIHEEPARLSPQLLSDNFLDDEEPLSHDEEVTLHHASQNPHLTQNYSFVYNYRRNSGLPLPALSSPSGTLSIESILNTNPEHFKRSESSSSLNNSSYPSSVRTGTGNKMMRRLSQRLSFIGSPDHDKADTKVSTPSSSASNSGSPSRRSSQPILSAASDNGINNKVSNTPSTTTSPPGTTARKTPTNNTSVSDLSSVAVLEDPDTSVATVPCTTSKVTSPAVVGTSIVPDTTSSPQRSPFLSHTNNTGSNITESNTGSTNLNSWDEPNSRSPKTMTMTSALSSTVGSADSVLDPRDNSLSPPGQLECSSSPVSSLIFERSVQEFNSPIDQKIPTHYHSENFIPPVLEASCNVITDSTVDPEAVEVISLRPRHMSISPLQETAPDFSTAISMDKATLTSIRPPSPPVSNSNTGFASPATEYCASRKTSVAELPGLRGSRSGTFPNDRNQHVLSFYSYADIVSAEHNPPTNTMGSFSSANSPTTSDLNSNFGFIGSRSPSAVGENLSPTSTSAVVMDDLDQDINIASMGETIRRNTGEIAAHHRE